MNTSKCRVEWCVLLPMQGSDLCAVHTQMPLLHSFESATEWGKRTRRSRAAAKKAAAKAADSDANIQKRGATR